MFRRFLAWMFRQTDSVPRSHVPLYTPSNPRPIQYWHVWRQTSATTWQFEGGECHLRDALVAAGPGGYVNPWPLPLDEWAKEEGPNKSFDITSEEQWNSLTGHWNWP